MDSYSNTHDPMSRSVAAISEVWTCNRSPPRNESGIRSSGGILESNGDDITEIDGLESRETRRLDEFLRRWTSSDERPCGTWCWSASNACGIDDSWITTSGVASGLGCVGLRLAG